MTQGKLPQLGMRSTPGHIYLKDQDAIHQATSQNQTELVLNILNNGTDIDRISDTGWTALQIASAHGRETIAEILLAHGADADIMHQGNTKVDSGTALHMAATNGHVSIVKLLLKHVTDASMKRLDGLNPLHLAVSRGRKDVVRVLARSGNFDLEERVGERARTALHMACEQGYNQCARELLSAGADSSARDNLGFTPLMLATAANHGSVVLDMLGFDTVDVDAKDAGGRTATSIAAYLGSVDALRFLISEGANLEIMDNDGTNALYHSIVGQNPRAAALLLLEHRIRVNLVYGTHEDTALHMAVSRDQEKIVAALLSSGADTEACDTDGDSPLNWAIEGNKMSMVKLLLRSGARINKKNAKSDETALHWAVKCGLETMTQALLAHGSDPTLVDLDKIQKWAEHEQNVEVEDAEFETCKILVETATLALDREIQPADQFEWPIDVSCAKTIGEQSIVHAESNTLDTAESVSSLAPDEDTAITNPIYEMPDQTAAADAIRAFQERVTHDGVKCNGPHCAQKSGHLQGIRFKCTVCDDYDLCSTCIVSYFNNHQHFHPVIKCLLPTHCHTIRDIDEESKMALAQAKPHDNVSPQDIGHVVYAVTDQTALSKLKFGLEKDPRQAKIEWSALVTLLSGEQSSTTFAISTQHGTETRPPRRKGIIRVGPDHGGVNVFKIDDGMNVTLHSFPIGEKPEVKDQDAIIHHQDPTLLADVMFGKVKRYNYGRETSFYHFASNGHLVTRVVDLKPGVFEDKIDFELRTIDLMQDQNYEALSYTWKETTYERSLINSMATDFSETLKNLARHYHGVYCHDAVTGEEAFLMANTGLRDALRRLRHEKKTRTLWIDQLSVNQEDKNERTFQVARMMHIYNRARRVVVWTGDEDPSTEEVFKFYQQLSYVHRQLKLFPTPMEYSLLSGAARSPLDKVKAIWKAAFEYFRRPVFGRSWCIQEMVVGQSVVVKCGGYEIEWSDLRTATQVMASRPWRVMMIDLSHKQLGHVSAHNTGGSTIAGKDMNDAAMDESIGSLTELLTTVELRDTFQSSKQTPLEILLYATGRFQATEGRDKIYSLLGIRGVRETSAISGDDIQPDYEKPDVEVFRNATQHCIRQSSTLHICGMTNTVSNKKITGLPTGLHFERLDQPLRILPTSARDSLPCLC